MMRSSNYFLPLQIVDEDNIDNEVIVEKVVKFHVSPITILKVKMEEVRELCKAV